MSDEAKASRVAFSYTHLINRIQGLEKRIKVLEAREDVRQAQIEQMNTRLRRMEAALRKYIDVPDDGQAWPRSEGVPVNDDETDDLLL